MKAGDVVRLKGGGPRMTVEVVDDGGVQCVWFDSTDRLQRDTYDAELVESCLNRSTPSNLPPIDGGRT
ncbi:MAG: DUF2158 domain-containing protein [Kofleriaceae bacterium]